MRYGRGDDDLDLADAFRELAATDPGSVEYRRRRDRIVERCLPIADHIARRFSGRGESREDLTQVARIGLLNAVIRFDPAAGSEFPAFAVPTIVGHIRHHFRDCAWSVKVPRRLKDLHVRLGAVSADLTQHLGRTPTPSELAAELGVDRATVIEGLVAGSSYRALSIDGGAGAENPRLQAENFGRDDLGLDLIEDRESLRVLLASLSERDRTVLALRFLASLTQAQIAERLGISQVHVSRILNRSLAALNRLAAA